MPDSPPGGYQSHTPQPIKEIEDKNTRITDSVHYAKRIQTAVLPTSEQLKNLLGNYFVLYKPKDIVSGDFYWAAEKNGKRIIVAADWWK